MANGVTTEWEDIHVKLGNYVAREKEKSNDEIFNENIEREAQKDQMTGKSFDQLKKEQEENLDSDDDEVLKEYERKRLAELKEFASKPKYGQLRELKSQDYIQEVNKAPKDVFVVLFLYQDSVMDSRVMERILTAMAKKFVLIKFMKILSTDCIKGIQDSNVPAIIVYYNGELIRQFIPATVYFGGKGKLDYKSKLIIFNF